MPTEGKADEVIDTVVQPDISVIRGPARLDERGCRGAPDWIIEVLSPATATHDQIIKRDLYERHGVREYWLVHPADRLVMVYRHQDGSYGKPAIHELEGHLAAAILPKIHYCLGTVAAGAATIS